jgi:lactate dehydrogenase-like 2-hydroxyacid dehydrogenase
VRHRLLVTRRLPEAVELRAQQNYDAILNTTDQPLGASLAQRAESCDALLVSSSDRLNAATIEALGTTIRVIATFSVGYNHIDVAAAARRGIVVANTPGVLTEATADIGMLLLLGAARRAFEGQEVVRSGRWPSLAGSNMFMLGADLHGAALGIVGMGRIGRALARRARASGMTIHYHNRRRLAQAEEAGAVYHPTLKGLFEVSSFLSLNCASSPETRHLIGEEQIGWLPRGAIFVNCARGELVVDDALVAALRSGHLFAAGLDVFEGEPAINQAYLTLPNVFMLPHLGSATVATRNAMGFKALDNIDAVLAGREAPDHVRA